jgi:kumamolisin
MIESQHVLLKDSHRPARAGAERVGDADNKAPLEVTLTLRGPDISSDNLPAHTLSPEQLAERYGASQADADTVERVLSRYGIKVDDTSLATRSMRVSGPVAAMQAAFHPNLGIYRSAEQGEYLGREGDLMVPRDLDGIVEGVFGLDQRQVARRRVLQARAAAAPLTPSDLETRYNFPPGDGAGQHVGIAEFGGGYFPTDLQAFCAKYGIPVAPVQTVAINLQPETLQQILQMPKPQRDQELDVSGEVNMDVQVVASLCPGAHISVYFATFDQKGWVDLLNRVIVDRPAVLSISWGLAEDSPDWSAAARRAINNRLGAAAALGITICISSGDDGSGDELNDGRGHVDFPSCSPFVLSVGGTMLVGDAADEQVWFQPPGTRAGRGGATGGGVSIFFQRPTWQNVMIQSINASSIQGRVIPDVAALAGPPFYDLILAGNDAPNGGTSASAPLWAALLTRINAALPANKRQRFLTPLLYQAGPNGAPLGRVCRDITVGQNASSPSPGVGYQAMQGFDAVTGWGVPDGVALLNALSV